MFRLCQEIVSISTKCDNINTKSVRTQHIAATTHLTPNAPKTHQHPEKRFSRSNQGINERPTTEHRRRFKLLAIDPEPESPTHTLITPSYSIWSHSRISCGWLPTVKLLYFARPSAWCFPFNLLICQSCHTYSYTNV